MIKIVKHIAGVIAAMVFLCFITPLIIVASTLLIMLKISK